MNLIISKSGYSTLLLRTYSLQNVIENIVANYGRREGRVQKTHSLLPLAYAPSVPYHHTCQSRPWHDVRTAPYAREFDNYCATIRSTPSLDILGYLCVLVKLINHMSHSCMRRLPVLKIFSLTLENFSVKIRNQIVVGVAVGYLAE
jgi:hypothetical protein